MSLRKAHRNPWQERRRWRQAFYWRKAMHHQVSAVPPRGQLKRKTATCNQQEVDVRRWEDNLNVASDFNQEVLAFSKGNREESAAPVSMGP